MRPLVRIVALLFLVLGVYMVVQAQEYEFFVVRVGAGAGFLPTFTGGAIALLAIILFVNSGRTEPAFLPSGFVPSRTELLRILVVSAALAVTVLAIEPLGYRITMFAFLIATMITLGSRNPVSILVVAVAGSLGVHWLFVEKLMVPLPTGMFGF